MDGRWMESKVLHVLADIGGRSSDKEERRPACEGHCVLITEFEVVMNGTGNLLGRT